MSKAMAVPVTTFTLDHLAFMLRLSNVVEPYHKLSATKQKMANDLITWYEAVEQRDGFLYLTEDGKQLLQNMELMFQREIAVICGAP